MSSRSNVERRAERSVGRAARSRPLSSKLGKVEYRRTDVRLIEATNMTVTDDGVDGIDGGYDDVDDDDDEDKVGKRGGGRRRNMKHEKSAGSTHQHRRQPGGVR